MLLELYIFFEILMVAIFFVAFFTKQEILWAVALVLAGVLMMTSYNVEYYVYLPNATSGMYYPSPTMHSYPYLMGLNMIFLILSLILGMFDIWDKYGNKFSGVKKDHRDV